MIKKLFVLFLATAATALSGGTAFAYSLSNPAPGFGVDEYSTLIPDTQFVSVSMGESGVADLLGKRGEWSNRAGSVSWMHNYIIPEYQTIPYKYNDGGTCKWGEVSARQYNDVTNHELYGISVAALIAREAAEHSVNPGVLLVTLEKEASAVTRATVQSDATQMWVLGYFWDETMASCGYGQSQAEYIARNFGGVGQQIAYSTAWFQSRYNQYASTYSNPISIDGITITPRTRAARVLYAYTPHVYNGNYNFWAITNQWFSPPTYAPSLGQDTDGTVYVLDEGKKWPVTGSGFAAWSFKWTNVHSLTNDERALPTGSTWTHLALGSDGTVYTIDNGRKRPLTSPRLIERYNFSWGDVQPKPDTILAKVPYGLPMHELVLPNGDGTVFLATAGTLYPVSGFVYNDVWRFAWADTARVPAYVTYNLPQGPLLSNLVVADGGDGTAYFVDDGILYPLPGSVAQAWGFNLGTIRVVGPALIAEKRRGGNLTTLVTQKDGNGTVYLIKDKKKNPVSGDYFRRQGYSYADVRAITAGQLDTLPTGSTLR
ncbi:MAG TPA: hypothetical protein VLA04_05980 [Verrucomicrobiae bacterium]|nr:hypothetical protein [Verrucomicrobiae bacterium]